MRRHPWLVVAVLAFVGVLLLGSFPTRAYLDQVHQRQQLARRAALLTGQNEALVEQARRLESDEAVERLARERYQLVRPGEEAYAILPDGHEADTPPAVEPARPAASRSWWARAWARITSVF